jgi:FAD/FMN-containing dehydrogenase
MAGSEGTLAVLTEATLNLVELPKQKGLCIVHFQSLVAAAEATPAILDCQPSAVELLDALLIDLTRSVPGYAAKLTFIEGHPAAVQIVEFYGETEAEVLSKIEQLEARLRSNNLAQTFVRALTPKQQADVWGIRTVGLGLLASMRGDAKPTTFMEDVAVPVEHLATWVRATERIFAAHFKQTPQIAVADHSGQPSRLQHGGYAQLFARHLIDHIRHAGMGRDGGEVVAGMHQRFDPRQFLAELASGMEVGKILDLKTAFF